MGDEEMTVDQSLTEVLDDFVAGNLSLSELCTDFEARDWTSPKMSQEAILANEDWEPPENSWAVVEEYRYDGDLTAEEYDVLVNCVVDSQSDKQEDTEDQD
jgi:hypothetical protein